MNAPSIYKSPAAEQAVMTIYDQALARWPVAYETLDIPTGHGQTFVVASGDTAAPPLILLHGAGSNSAIWAGDVEAYSRPYRVYAVDLLGEPGRSAPNRPAWDSPAYAEWLDEVLTALKIERATLVGISQGGWTALKLATWKPERVEKLVLMTPGGIVPDKMSFLVYAVFFSLTGRWGARRLNRMLFAGQTIPEGVEDILWVMTRSFKPRMGMLPLFSDEELARLTMPTLLLGGTRDALRDLDKIAARLRTYVPHLKTVLIPEAGHALLNTTEPVLSFLAAE